MDVHDIYQAAVKMLDHFDPLRFTSRQCIGGWLQTEIPLATSKSSSTSIAAMSAILHPLTLQLKAAWLSRAPLQSGQGPSFKKGSTFCRMRDESVWMSRATNLRLNLYTRPS